MSLHVVLRFMFHVQIAFHGININKEEVLLDGSEAPVRIDAEALIASEKLAPAAILNKVKLVHRLFCCFIPVQLFVL